MQGLCSSLSAFHVVDRVHVFRNGWNVNVFSHFRSQRYLVFACSRVVDPQGIQNMPTCLAVAKPFALCQPLSFYKFTDGIAKTECLETWGGSSEKIFFLY